MDRPDKIAPELRPSGSVAKPSALGDGRLERGGTGRCRTSRVEVGVQLVGRWILARLRRGTCSKLSQNNSIIAAIMRLSAVALAGSQTG
jgi:hypothetical protein